MKSDTRQHICNSMTVIFLKFKIADGRHIESRFGNNSAADSPTVRCPSEILYVETQLTQRYTRRVKIKYMNANIAISI